MGKIRRFTVVRDIRRSDDPHSFDINVAIRSTTREDSRGEFVLWSDVEEMIKELEEQIPSFQIKKLQDQITAVSTGKCPECGEKVHGYKSPTGSFGPELFAGMRDRGLDPCTGHKVGCSIGRADR